MGDIAVNIFSDVKAQLDLINVVQHYGIRLNRGDFMNCLFHEDRTPSMKLYNDHFHCYGCGEHGDVIKLTGHLFSLPPYEAVQKLAQDFHINIDKIFAVTTKIKSIQSSYIFRENQVYKMLNEYCHFLEECREMYKPSSSTDELHPLFVESLTNYELYNYYRDIFITGSKEERIEIINCFKDEMTSIEQRFFLKAAN